MPIVDQGYQHWSGHLSSHAWRWLAITRHGVRVGLKGRALRRILFAAWMPAVGLAAFLCVWGLLERKSEPRHAVHAAVAEFLATSVLADPAALSGSRSGRSASAISWTSN